MSKSLRKHEQRVRALRRFKACRQYLNSVRTDKAQAMYNRACTLLRSLDIEPKLLEPVNDEAKQVFDNTFAEPMRFLDRVVLL